MTEQLAFVQAICTEPADDTPRLVYADWLQENDQPERAESGRHPRSDLAGH